jgi:Flp pilus assembly pilin Flp
MIRHAFSGQGLVEYALVLTLVGLVVIVVTALLGPSIGSIFSNVTTTLNSGEAVLVTPTTAPGPAGAWIYCADEHTTCTFPGTKTIRYGANGHYITQVLTNTTPCDNETFGDPIYGTFKYCHYWDPAASP